MSKCQIIPRVFQRTVELLALSVLIYLSETIFSVPSTAVTAATQSVSLAELLQRTEKNAAFVKDIEALERQAREKLSQVNANRWLTDFNMKILGGIIPDAKLIDERDVNTYDPNSGSGKLGGFMKLSIEAVQPIYTFGKISGFEEMAKRNIQLSNYEKQKKVSELRALVKRAYYTFQLANDSIRILSDVEKRLQEAASKVEELLVKNADNVTETDRLKIRVFEADAKNRRLDADRAQRLSRSAISELANLLGDWELEAMSLTAERVEDLKKEDAISLALRTKPELNQLTEAIAMRKAERRTIRADLFPMIFIAGKVDYSVAPGRHNTENPYLNDPFNGFDPGVALGLKQDLGFWRTKNRMNQMQADIDRLGAQLEQLRIKTKLDAEKSFEEAVSASEAQRINEDGFRAARSWLTAAGLSFNLGTAETKDVLESFAAYFKAQVDLTRSIYTLNLALSDLSNTVGVEVVDRLKATDRQSP